MQHGRGDRIQGTQRANEDAQAVDPERLEAAYEYLLEYPPLGLELRATIQAATNKSESFNAFVKWLAFGGGGVIAENDRGEQRKLIKYNHLLANCLIFHNVCMMTRALHKLRAEGVKVEPAAVAALSPYVRSHITRFGQYNVDLSRRPEPIDYELPFFTDGNTETATVGSAT